MISKIFGTCWTICTAFPQYDSSHGPKEVKNVKSLYYQKVKLKRPIPSSYAYMQRFFGKTDNNANRCQYGSSCES